MVIKIKLFVNVIGRLLLLYYYISFFQIRNNCRLLRKEVIKRILSKIKNFFYIYKVYLFLKFIKPTPKIFNNI